MIHVETVRFACRNHDTKNVFAVFAPVFIAEMSVSFNAS
jgi:hypothetical protein